MNMKPRCRVDFLDMPFGTYLTSMGRIGRPAWVAISAYSILSGCYQPFMPALMGIVADRWIRQKTLINLPLWR